MQEFFDLDTYFSLDPSQLADSVLYCPECGHDHRIPIKNVISGSGLLPLFPSLIKDILGNITEVVGVVYDRQIEEEIERRVIQPLKEQRLSIVRVPLGQKDEILDASTTIGDEAAASLPDSVPLLISAGSGVISDLTKWIATQRKIPYILLGTAASMNAYTSITGSMSVGDVKTSKWLDPASAVLLDTDLLVSAPPQMTCAGIGDLLARNVANADWKLASLIRGVYFCSVPYQMMAPYQQSLLSGASALGSHHPRQMKNLADAILVSGYSMTVLNGETSPSSGAEHILSHFFDFQHHIFGLPKNLHGTQVGLASIITSAAYELLQELDITQLDIDEIEQRRLSEAVIKLDHRRVFGDHGVLFDKVVTQKRIPEVEFREYISGILTKWNQIVTEISHYLLPSETIRTALEEAGGATKLVDIHRTEEEVIQALLYGSHYRPRYTILDLFWELGLLPDIVPEILKQAQV